MAAILYLKWLLPSNIIENLFILAILKDADLTEMSTKKVRTQIEKKLECNLLSRKKEIDEIVMSFVNEQANDAEDDSEEESEEEKPKKKAPAKPKPAKKAPTKRKKSESSAGSDEDSDAPRTKSAKKEKAKKKKSGEDDDWKANGKPKKVSIALKFQLKTIYCNFCDLILGRP